MATAVPQNIIWQELARPKEPAGGHTKHNCEAKHPEDNGGEGKVGEVFHDNIDVVLTANNPCFETEKASLH